MLNTKLVHAACILFIIQTALSVLVIGGAFLVGFLGVLFA